MGAMLMPTRKVKGELALRRKPSPEGRSVTTCWARETVAKSSVLALTLTVAESSPAAEWVAPLSVKIARAALGLNTCKHEVRVENFTDLSCCGRLPQGESKPWLSLVLWR